MLNNKFFVGTTVFFANPDVRKGIILGVALSEPERKELLYDVYEPRYDRVNEVMEEDIFLAKAEALERSIEKIKNRTAGMTEDKIEISIPFLNKYKIGDKVYCLYHDYVKEGEIYSIGFRPQYLIDDDIMDISKRKLYIIMLNSDYDSSDYIRYAIIEEKDIFATEEEAIEEEAWRKNAHRSF